MPEKLPLSERPEPEVFGSAPKEKQEVAKLSMIQRFGEKHLEQISKQAAEALATIEHPKQPFEQEAIKTANVITNRLLEKFGLPQFDVPERNIHVIPQKQYLNIFESTDSSAITVQDQQAIMLNADKLVYPIDRISAILHEVIHLKNFLRLEVRHDNEIIHRSGLKTNANEKKEKNIGPHNLFDGFNEAIVSEMEKYYFAELVKSNPFLKSEWEWLNSKKAQLFKEQLVKERNIPPEEVMWVEKTGQGCSLLAYYEQRQVLNYVVEQIYEITKDRFDSKDAVMEQFFAAHFSGRMLPIARLVESAFDRGSFRILSMMGVDPNSSRVVMAYLKKHRQVKTAL